MQSSNSARPDKNVNFAPFVKVLISLLIAVGFTYLTAVGIDFLADRFALSKNCSVDYGYGEEVKIDCNFNVSIRLLVVITVVPWYLIARKLTRKVFNQFTQN